MIFHKGMWDLWFTCKPECERLSAFIHITTKAKATGYFARIAVRTAKITDWTFVSAVNQVVNDRHRASLKLFSATLTSKVFPVYEVQITDILFSDQGLFREWFRQCLPTSARPKIVISVILLGLTVISH